MPPLTFAAFRRVFRVAIDGPVPRIAVFSRAPEADVYKVAAEQRKALRKREAQAVARMRTAWQGAYRNIAARLAEVVDTIDVATENGDPISPAWLYQQERWTAFLNTIRQEIEGYADTASGIALDGQSQAVDHGTQDAAAMVEATGVQTGFTMLPRAAFEDMVGFLADGSPLADLFATIAQQAVAAARVVFEEGVAAGDHPYKIARALRKRMNVTRDRAVLIARTETIRAYTTAQQRNYAANSDVVIASRIVSSRDARTCFLCIARDGTILMHGDPFPRHPGCRCALAPVVRFLDVDRGTGEEWLRRQSAKVQREKLGPSRWAKWSEGEASLGDMVEVTDHARWGKGLRPLTLRQIDDNIAAGIRVPEQRVWVEGMIPKEAPA